MDCRSRKDLLPPYALGALDAAEEAEIRAHLAAGCPTCEGNLAGAQAMLSMIPLALEPLAPPAAAREKLMARVAASQRPDATANPKSPALSRASRATWLRPALAGGIAAAALTALGFSAVLTAQRNNLDALRTQLSSRDDQVRALQATVHDAKDEIRLIESPAVQVVALAGTKDPSAARGRLYWDPARKALHFYAAGLPALPPDKVYELWLINDKQAKIPAGTFTVDASGEGALASAQRIDPGTLAAVGVTAEQAPGAAQPTMADLRLLGKVQ